MIQILLMLLGFIYPNNHTDINNSTPNFLQATIQKDGNGNGLGNGGNTGGDTGQTPP